ncbi:ATP-dependent DNA helicase PIF1-like protein, partial [Tanacetum coccineum]
DDVEWVQAIRNASQWKLGNQLREMFVTILLFCRVSDHNSFFKDVYQYISEDVVRKQRRLLHNQNVVFTDQEVQNYTLLELEDILNVNNKSLVDFPELPQLDYTLMNIGRNRLIAAERMYNANEEWSRFTSLYGGLNPQQRDVYDNIMQAVNERNGGLFFVYGCGGTGKTYLWKTIISWIRSLGRIVLSVASSGIASLLLPGGRTAHSRFRIPMELDNESCCGIDVVSDLADLIRAADLIIWDEAPLQHRHAFEAVDRTFRDICRFDNPNADNQVFGRKVVVLGGDFRKILPVIPNVLRDVVVSSAVNKSSSIWDYCKVFVLSINMRLHDPTLDVTNADEIMRFNNWLIAMGDGRLPCIALDGEDDATWITIPEDLLIPIDDNPVEAIMSSTFQDLLNRIQDVNYLKERCIMSPTNDVVDKINSHVLASMSGEMHEHLSADTICYTTDNLEDMQIMYPPEFLNTLSSYRSTMSIRCHYVDDLHPNLTDKWTLNVMAARVWTTYNPNNNRVLSINLIIVDERGPELKSTVSSQIYLNLSQRLIEPVSFTLGTESEELKVTSITDIYKHLADGVTLGTRFIIYGMVIGINLDKDWKYIQCTKCFKRARLDGSRYYCEKCAKHVMNPRLTYKLVITVQDDGEEIECVLFNSKATPLLGITVEELFYKTITEIDKYNIAPTYVRRYTATKYYGHDVNDINKHIGISSSSESVQKIVCSDLSISSPDVNDINKHIGILSSSGSVKNMVYSDLSISSPDSYWDTTDYGIHDDNLGSTISEYEEKLMDELEWGQDVSILKPAATHICTNEVPHAPDTSTNDFSVNDPNKGKSIVDAEPVVVETHLNDFTHDESSSLPELASDVNKDVSPLSSPTIEPDEMPTRGDEDKMMISVDEAAINQHVDIMQDD